MERCAWVNPDNPLYVKYHDEEWGVPVRDDRKLFEMLILEGAQAGLSFETILKKRETYRRAFDDFDPSVVASYGEEKVAALLQDPGIVRNRLKVRSAVSNAKVFLEIQEAYGSFSAYLWGFVDDTPIVNHYETIDDVPATTALSEALSKDLKKRGMRFVGATIIYAYMQAVGMVDDHVNTCFKKGR